MAQICTTREQGKKLQELGVSVDTADMSWYFTNMKSEALQWELKTNSLTTKENFFGKIEKLVSPLYKHSDGTPMTGEEVFDKIWGKDLPAWSLGALIELMPDRLIYEDVEFKLLLNNKVVRYESKGVNLTLSGCVGENLFENCGDMIEWLVNGGYIKNE